jgi:hypothetical protein
MVRPKTMLNIGVTFMKGKNAHAGLAQKARSNGYKMAQIFSSSSNAAVSQSQLNMASVMKRERRLMYTLSIDCTRILH